MAKLLRDRSDDDPPGLWRVVIYGHLWGRSCEGLMFIIGAIVWLPQSTSIATPNSITSHVQIFLHAAVLDHYCNHKIIEYEFKITQNSDISFR